MIDWQLMAIIVGVCLTLILTSLRVRRRVRNIEAKSTKLRSISRDLAKAIRKVARDNYHHKKAARGLDCERDALIDAITQLKSRLVDEEKVDRRIYVLDDRKSKGDRGWVFTMVHCAYKTHIAAGATQTLNMQWVAGRRYVVWATTQENAIQKLHAKLPPEKGFQIRSVARHNEDKAA